MSTIHPQVRTSHEAAGVGYQERSGTSVLLRLAQASQHILLGPLGLPLWEFLEQSLDHGSYDVARGDGVDSNTVLTPFRGKVAAELDNSCLRGIVCRADQTLFLVSN